MKNYLSIFFLIGIVLLSGCGKKDEQPESEDAAVNLYLVAYEGSSFNGKKIGCGDFLVPVAKKVKVEKSLIYSAVRELISIKDTDELKNFVRGPQLMLLQVTIAGGIADIYLTGDLMIRGACDIPRIREQLFETAAQFSELKKIRFYINNQPLEKYLEISGKGL